MSKLKEALAQLAANVTIEKLKKEDFRASIVESITNLWNNTEKAKMKAAAAAGKGWYEFTFRSNCGASAEELALLLPQELREMKPFVWRKGSHSSEYDIKIDWEIARDLLIEQWQSDTQREVRKRKREEEATAQEARLAAEKESKKRAAEEPAKKKKPEKAADLPAAPHAPDKPSAKGAEELMGKYISFQHCGKTIEARVSQDDGGAQLSVIWYAVEDSKKAEYKMTLDRTRVSVLTDQEKARGLERQTLRSVCREEEE